MKQGLLLWCFVIVICAAAEEEPPKPQCSPTQTFVRNLHDLVVRPILDGTDYVMALPKGTHPHTGAMRTAWNSCERAGIRTGVDVAQVLMRVWTGFGVGTWPELEACTRLVLLSSLEPLERERAEVAGCDVATQQMRCAHTHALWVVPWVLGVVGGCVLLSVVSTCVFVSNI